MSARCTSESARPQNLGKAICPCDISKICCIGVPSCFIPFLADDVITCFSILLYGSSMIEPHKCKGWSSFSWGELQRISANQSGGELRLFGPLKSFVELSPQSVLDFLRNDK